MILVGPVDDCETFYECITFGLDGAAYGAKRSPATVINHGFYELQSIKKLNEHFRFGC
jgi:hypothetical protein